MSERQDPRELIGPFVLGACTPEEEAEVRAHMVASPSFRAEVESYDIVRDALLEQPSAVADVAPGIDLKRSVMAHVQAEASLFRAAGPGEDDPHAREPDSGLRPAAADHVHAPGRGADEATPTTPRRRAFLAALRHPSRVAALAAVLVALIVGGVVLSGTGGDDPARQDVFYGQITDPASAKDATVKMVARGDRSELHVHGFRAAGAGKQYQVWLRTGDEAPKPTKVLFDVDAQGNATAVVRGDMSKVDDVLVTPEPVGGSRTPTADPVFHIQI